MIAFHRGNCNGNDVTTVFSSKIPLSLESNS